MHTADDRQQTQPTTVTRCHLLTRGGLAGVSALGLALFNPVLAAHQPVAMAGTARCGPRFLALHNTKRKLWEDHITWTQLFIVSFAADIATDD